MEGRPVFLILNHKKRMENILGAIAFILAICATMLIGVLNEKIKALYLKQETSFGHLNRRLDHLFVSMDNAVKLSQSNKDTLKDLRDSYKESNEALATYLHLGKEGQLPIQNNVTATPKTKRLKP
jgi:hypothetical protein